MSENEAIVPHDPVLITAHLPAAGGRLGPEPEDFVVDEVPAFQASGQGEHWWVRVRKRLWTTPDMVRMIARAADADERDLGYAGMKDKHAVTTQWVSVPVRHRPPSAWQLAPGVELVEAIRHGQKLRTGQLSHNHFRLRLQGLDQQGFSRAQTIAEHLRVHGLLNYFGSQRFGQSGGNLGRALMWLRRGAPPAGGRTRFYRKLYPSVVQAEVYNRYLTARRQLGLHRVLAGDIMRLGHSKAVFTVDDPEREQPRLVEREIRLTGPIWAPR